jgi:hypothetical protein
MDAGVYKLVLGDGGINNACGARTVLYYRRAWCRFALTLRTSDGCTHCEKPLSLFGTSPCIIEHPARQINHAGIMLLTGE